MKHQGACNQEEGVFVAYCVSSGTLRSSVYPGKVSREKKSKHTQRALVILLGRP